jgi:ABC-type transporter MlaC component
LINFSFSEAKQNSPEEFIENLYKEIKVINLSRIATTMQLKKIKEEIINNVDFDIVSNFLLGKSAKKVLKEDLQNFKIAYQNYLGNKYSKLLLGYSKSLQILNTENIGKSRFLIRTNAKLNDAKNDIKISYLIVLTDAGYKIIDIIFADGVSLVITDRNEFLTFLEKGAIKDLIKKLSV